MKKGEHHSIESKRLLSYYATLRIGEKAPNWKGGSMIVDGYKYIYNPKHPNATKDGYICEHRLVMENIIGRYLTQKEVVHHLDGNKLNNLPENLKIFPSTGIHSINEHCIKDCLGRFSKIC